MKHKLLLPILLSSLLASCGIKVDDPYMDSHDAFSYNGNFENPELNIDGKDDEDAWKSEYASSTYSITYQSKSSNNTENQRYRADFKLYRGEKELCVFVKVTDPNLLTVGNDNGNNVSLSDSVEIYLDTLLNGGERPQSDDYQINLGIHNKTRVLVGNGSGWSSWTGLVQYEAILNGTMNKEDDVDEGYSIEMSIPYKQIGIERDTKIGVAFGLVDKYSSKTTNSKMWYGLTYKGNFANPQKPDTYFIYDKNSLSIPPVPTYDETKDTHEYKLGYGSLKAGKTTSANHPEIDIGVFRKDDEVAFRLDNKGAGWGENSAYWFYFDGGEYGKTVRDENSWCIRLTPVGGVSNFFYLGGPNLNKDVASKNKLSVMVDDRYMYLCYSLSLINEKYVSKPVAFALASADLTTQKVMVTMTSENGKASMSNPSTFAWIDSSGELFSNDYDPIKDTTPYLTSVGLIKDNPVDVYRKENTLKLRVKAVDETLMSNYSITFYFDASSKDSTTRNNSTWCLRIKLKEKTVKDYFMLGPDNKNKAILQTGIALEVSSKYLVVSLPLDGVSSTYKDKDIGFTCSLFNPEFTKLDSTMKVNEVQTNNSNPSTFVWIDSASNLK